MLLLCVVALRLSPSGSLAKPCSRKMPLSLARPQLSLTIKSVPLRISSCSVLTQLILNAISLRLLPPLVCGHVDFRRAPRQEI
mmetsp:Transcript_19054/g.48790  ORF Transcript_19054/g.48790 Transcript_19054/m.48790 type:complete len:83 (-) Transcript_19054:580-828(-)